MDISQIIENSADKGKMTITTLGKHFRAVKAVFTTANIHSKGALNLDYLYAKSSFPKMFA